MFDVDEYIRINEKHLSDAAERSQQPGFVLQLINDPMLDQRRLIKHESAICLETPRRGFGAKDDDLEATINNIDNEKGIVIPSFINVTKLETLRFRHRSKINNAGPNNGAPKSILNVHHAPR
jgi:hypothetical protein